MKKLVLIILILALIYNVFAGSSDFWDYYYFLTRDLSIAALIYINIDKVNGITMRVITLFTAILFMISGLCEFYLPVYFPALISILVIISYGLIFRAIFNKKLKSDSYSQFGTYIIIRKPKRIFELLRAYIFLDSIGSIKIVTDAQEVGFKIKKHGVEAVECRHTYNPNHYIYIYTNKKIELKNKRYNILFNNCINGWNINIKKELKNAGRNN